MTLNLTDLDGRVYRWKRRECTNGGIDFFVLVVVEWRIRHFIVHIIRRIHDVVDVLIESSNWR